MPVFKVQTIERSRKVTVFADSLSVLVERAVRKLNLLDKSYHIYDDVDGTLIDDDESLCGMAEFTASKGSVLLLTMHDGQWSPQMSDVSTPTGTPIPTETSAPVEIGTPSTPLSSISNVNVAALQIPIRPLTEELQKALKVPAHLRHKALCKGRRSVVKSLAEKLKRMTLFPGDVRKVCKKVHDSCPEAFSIAIRENCVSSNFNQFVKAVYNATGYARETDVGNETPRRGRSRTIHRLDEDDPEELVPFLCLDSNGCVEGMYAPLISGEDDLLFEELRTSLLNYTHMVSVEQDTNVLRDFKLTYPLQRKFINDARTASDWRQVFAAWPLLQKQRLLLVHADLLLGKDTLALWLKEMAGLEAFHKFMAEVALNLKANPSTRDSSSALDECLEDCQLAQESQQSRKPMAVAIAPLLLAYFKEKKDLFYTIVDENSDKETILEKAKSISECPLLVIKGQSLFDSNATAFVVVRGMYIMQAQTVVEGVLCVVLCYFVFNISYPKQIFKTLEFFQRFFLRINPSVMGRFNGVKAKRSVNVAVANLAGKLSDFEAKISRWSLGES